MSLYAPKTPPFDGGPATGQSLAGLAGLDARARDIFRRIVESYLQTGEPVGSGKANTIGGSGNDGYVAGGNGGVVHG